MPYSKVKKLIKELPAGFEFHLNGTQINGDVWDQYDDERFSSDPDMAVVVALINRKTGTTTKFLVSESFECCGKAYFHSFQSQENRKRLKLLFQLAVLLIRYAGYSAVGLIHLEDDLSLEVARGLGFKEAFTFENERSANTLVEMYKIL